MIYNDGTYEENGEIWFIGYNDNIIYHMSQNHEVELIDKIPTKGIDTYRMNPMCIKDKNRLICLPSKSCSVYVYDIEKQQFKEIPIKLDVNRYSIENAWVEGEILWCISYRSGELIKCNIETGNYKKFSVCDKSLVCASGEALRINNSLYILHKKKCRISKFDMITDKIVDYDLPCDDIGFGTIGYIDGKFLLTGYKKNIYIWSENNNQVDVVPINNMRFLAERESVSETARFLKSKIIKDYFIAIPFNNSYFISDGLVVYNWKTGNLKIYTLSADNKKRCDGDDFVYNYSCGDKVYIQDPTINQYWEIDLSKEEVKKREITVDRKSCETYWKRHGVDGVNLESNLIDLDIFIKNI